MMKRALLGGVTGIGAAVVAWLLTLPFLPVLMVPVKTAAGHAEVTGHFTLGSLYGTFGVFLFGALAGLGLLLVYSAGRPGEDRARGVLISTLAGGLLVGAAYGFGQFVGIKMYQGGAAAFKGSWSLELLWAFVVSAMLNAAVLLGLGIRRETPVRFAVATGFGTVACFFLRQAASHLTAPLATSVMVSAKTSYNAWAVTAPALLATNIAMGIGVGVCLAVAERLTRTAWMHLKLTYGEGHTWMIEDPVVMIGSTVGVGVRVEEMQGFAPMHAQIIRCGIDFAIQDLGPGVRLNGNTVASGWLADNDVISLGPYEFIFHLRRPVERRNDVVAPSVLDDVREEKAKVKAEIEPMRFEDDFGNKYPLVSRVSFVGRDESCEVCLKWDTTMSRRHAEVVLGPNGAMIRDLDSANGTKLNGRVIQSVKVPLKEGDIVEFGTARVVFHE